MVVPALLVGTLGYVIGNYYGIFVGTFHWKIMIISNPG